MDGTRFDALARSFARPTRRGLLGAALGALAAGLTARGGDAAAVGRPLGSLCRKGGECASGTCIPDATGRGRCACAGGSAGQCGASCCADCFAQRDPDNSEVVTPICCPSASVCPGATGAPGDDQCCWFDEVCLPPNTSCCRSDANGGCDVAANCAGCCRACGTDATGNQICCDEMEQCVTTQSGQQCEPLNTARLSRGRF